MRSNLILFIVFFISTFSFCKKEELKSIQTYDVKINIQMPDGTKTYDLKIESSRSIYDVMKTLQEQKQIQMDVQGTGDLIFLTSLNNIKNEGSGKNKKNWIFAVNGKLGEKGIAQYQISENITVDWCYLPWEEKEKCGLIPESLKDHEVTTKGEKK